MRRAITNQIAERYEGKSILNRRGDRRRSMNLSWVNEEAWISIMDPLADRVAQTSPKGVAMRRTGPVEGAELALQMLSDTPPPGPVPPLELHGE
jgi:hypothetical protein